MKKAKLLLSMSLLIILFIGCQENGAIPKEKEVIKIGTSSLQIDMLEVAKKEFDKSDQYEMEIILFDDAVLPNTSLAEKSTDANFYQHKPFMEAFNQEHGTDIKPYGDPIVASPVGVFSYKYEKLEDIEDGSTIAFANDTTNRGIAIELLAKLGMLKVKDGVEIPSQLDIVENPHNFEFIEIERLGLLKALDDTDVAVMVADTYFNGGKDPSDALATSDEESLKRRAIFVGIRGDQEETEWLKLLENSLKSDSVKSFLNVTYKGSKVPLF